MAVKLTLLKKLVLFAVMIVGVIVALLLINWLGDSVGEGGIRRFTSITEARQQLAFSQLYLPAYRPQRYQWPPSEILGRRSPIRTLLLHIQDSTTGEVVLAIAQTEPPEAGSPELRLQPIKKNRQIRILLEGRPAILIEGECRSGDTCRQLTWTEGSFLLTVAAKATSEELLRIAESMLSGS